ncbi:MAG: helix-turn-helix domain-containing protein [Magnetococcales bacterium]|nr:helix-turn-helix domain-containing protein [Magnetococcales bacterium]
MMPAEISIENLPMSLQDIGVEIGINATLKLSEEFGGIEICPPRDADRITEDHRISKAIGLPAAQKLVRLVGGDRFYIPKMDKIKLNVRHVEIVRRYDQGEAVRDIAQAFGLSERHIWRILKKPLQG